MSIKGRISAWLDRSVGNRIRLVGVATSAGLVLALGLIAFPLFFYQSWQNFNDHVHNSSERIADRLEFRISTVQQSLDQLSSSSFIVNSYVDSAGREVYLAPTLRDFRLPIDATVKLVLFDANLTPFARNFSDQSVLEKTLHGMVARSFKSEQRLLEFHMAGGRNNIALAFPVFYPPSATYEGVMLALIDADALLMPPKDFLEAEDCLSVETSTTTLFSINCNAEKSWGNISRPLSGSSQLGSATGLSLRYGERSLLFLPQFLAVGLIYFLIGVLAVWTAYRLSSRASDIFTGQLKSLGDTSRELADSPGAQTRVVWAHPDEIGQFVEAFNTMVDRLQQLQVSLEERVEARTNELRIILDNVLDGILTVDEHGTIETFNNAAQDIFGYTADEVIGRNIKVLMPDPFFSKHDSIEQDEVMRILSETPEPIGRRKDGSTFPVDLAISKSVHEGRTLYFGVIRDITERKRIDEMKSEFISTVSHELRTPLTSISGALGLMAGGVLGELSDQAKQMVYVASKNAIRLTTLINDLLDMDKLVAGKMTFDMQVQPLMPLIEQALESIHAYGEQYQVKFEIAEQVDVPVRVDAGRLTQVLNNFLSNAAKFSHRGGQVEIAVRRMDAAVRIEVIDHGLGIPGEFRDRIFQKFAQADSSDTRQKGGTGLGLAISMQLIERMGGTVGFDSVEGRGSTFYFELPLSERRKITPPAQP